ncbi:hypothetical protein [Curtobacterium sp. MCPF17_052]|uniref:hypothetical protein n=1 Tax=Curtobacterium sp. MCPF17_052 TaxID=2175655 RepID=UPI0024E01579|nr:hypothetical protein [Curtobacterium sp. MCPF17_052]WIB11799.1 hypothetical protein DEJ36_13030 [Curtobacterium sp. MCPF17_052]
MRPLSIPPWVRSALAGVAFLAVALLAMEGLHRAGWYPTRLDDYRVTAALVALCIVVGQRLPYPLLVVVGVVVAWPTWAFDVLTVRLIPPRHRRLPGVRRRASGGRRAGRRGGADVHGDVRAPPVRAGQRVAAGPPRVAGVVERRGLVDHRPDGDPARGVRGPGPCHRPSSSFRARAAAPQRGARPSAGI